MVRLSPLSELQAETRRHRQPSRLCCPLPKTSQLTRHAGAKPPRPPQLPAQKPEEPGRRAHSLSLSLALSLSLHPLKAVQLVVVASHSAPSLVLHTASLNPTSIHPSFPSLAHSLADIQADMFPGPLPAHCAARCAISRCQPARQPRPPCSWLWRRRVVFPAVFSAPLRSSFAGPFHYTKPRPPR